MLNRADSEYVDWVYERIHVVTVRIHAIRIHLVRIHIVRIPGSRNLGLRLCCTNTHPSLGSSPRIPRLLPVMVIAAVEDVSYYRLL